MLRTSDDKIQNSHQNEIYTHALTDYKKEERKNNHKLKETMVEKSTTVSMQCDSTTAHSISYWIECTVRVTRHCG